MSSKFKWFMPVVAIGSMLMFSTDGAFAKKDGKSKKSDTASVIVDVKDSSGKPVANAKVRLLLGGSKKADKQAGIHAKKDAIKEGVTDAKGRVEFTDVADGEYDVAAHAKGDGKGREKVSVMDRHAKVDITLDEKKK